MTRSTSSSRRNEGDESTNQSESGDDEEDINTDEDDLSSNEGFSIPVFDHKKKDVSEEFIRRCEYLDGQWDGERGNHKEKDEAFFKKHTKTQHEELYDDDDDDDDDDKSVDISGSSLSSSYDNGGIQQRRPERTKHSRDYVHNLTLSLDSKNYEKPPDRPRVKIDWTAGLQPQRQKSQPSKAQQHGENDKKKRRDE